MPCQEEQRLGVSWCYRRIVVVDVAISRGDLCLSASCIACERGVAGGYGSLHSL